MKCIDEEIPFEIPQGWAWCRLSSIVSLLGDGIHGTPEYSEIGSVFFINGNNLSDGRILIKPDTKKVTEEEAAKHLRFLNASTVLVSINGTIGNIAFYSGEKVILGKSACYFNLMSGIQKEYVKIVLQTDYFLEYAKRVATGSTIKNVPLSGMRNLLVPIPLQKEQQDIIENLKSLTSLIIKYDIEQSQLDVLNASLNSRLRKSILQEAIQGKLVPQIVEEGTAHELLEQIRQEKQKLVKKGKLKKSALTDSIIFKGDDNKYYEKKGKNIECVEEELPFEIPSSWSWCHLPSIGTSDLGKTMDKGKDSGKSVPYLCSINVYWNKIDLSTIKYALFTENELKKCKLEKEDLLICEGGDIGRCAIWEADNEMYYQNALHRVRLYGNISPRYLQLIITLYKSCGIIDDVSKGVTIKHFTQTALHGLYLPIPPLGEQSRILDKVKLLLHLIK